MGTRAAARTVAQPFRFTKLPVLGGLTVWRPPVVVRLAKNGISGQLLRRARGVFWGLLTRPTYGGPISAAVSRGGLLPSAKLFPSA